MLKYAITTFRHLLNEVQLIEVIKQNSKKYTYVYVDVWKLISTTKTSYKEIKKKKQRKLFEFRQFEYLLSILQKWSTKEK